MNSKTLKQSLFLQLHRLATHFLKHILRQIFNSSTQSGMPNAEYCMTGNIRHIPYKCSQYWLRAMREVILSLRHCFIIGWLGVARILLWTSRVFSTWPCLTALTGRVEMQSILQDTQQFKLPAQVHSLHRKRQPNLCCLRGTSRSGEYSHFLELQKYTEEQGYMILK